MPLLQATNIRHAYGENVILDGATLSIEPGQRVGLVGRNGAGKSTLVRVLAGQLTPDAGSVNVTRGSVVGHLTQDHDLDPDETLRLAAEGAFEQLHHTHAELEKLYDTMASASGEALEKLMARQAQLEERVESLGGYAIGHRIDATLHGLGFTDAQFALECRHLSGGQRSRLSLARLLLRSPDMLLLDEPTNHLDIEGREWLEDFLINEYRGAVLMITHDRRMLDNVVRSIYEVEQGRLIEYPGNYQKFRELRTERRVTMLRAWEKQQTKFKQEEAYIRKYKTGQRAKEARGRQSKLDRARRDSTLEKPVELDVFRFELPGAPRPGDILLTARDITKQHPVVDPASNEVIGQKTLFKDFSIQIGRGERWGIIGPNGAGKTTLVRTLLGEAAPDSGHTSLGSNLHVGYFHQLPPEIDPEIPAYRAIQKLVVRENPDVDMSEQRTRDLAGAFLFSGDEQDKPVGVLSGGERARILLASILASGKNLLVLDEPTNHLDIPSAERLEEALSKGTGYEGAIILISHDRALLDAVCDQLIVLDGEGGASIHHASYTDWHEKAARQQPGARAPQPRQPAAKKATQKPRATGKKSSALELLSTDKLESRIERIETRIKEIDVSMGTPEVWQDHQKATSLAEERAQLTEELEPLEFEWSRRIDDLV
ncbi:MAG: ribosomal protection-like ABC-F family protein [Phycisphaerales bacterium JB043]